MKKILTSLIIFGIYGCSISPKEFEEMNYNNNSYMPSATIKCMQFPPNPHRPHPINKKGKTGESYDQSDCFDDVISKNQRELILKLDKTSIKIELDKNIEQLPENQKNNIEDIDIEALKEKVLNKPKKE